mgnify:CR=1 FL=1|jgi:hypothetical protein
MWLFAFAIIALIVGNVLRKRGLEASRSNMYGSAAALAGQRASGIGTWINIAGAAALVAAACWLWL